MAYNVNTLGDVINETYDEASIDGDSVDVAGLERAAMEKWANRYAKWFLRKTKLPAQERTTGYRTLADNTLSVAAVSGDASLIVTQSVSTIGWPTSGYILLDGVPLQYTNYVGTTITLHASSVVPKSFDAGDTVQVGYVLPTLFGKPITLWVEGSPYTRQKWGLSKFASSQHYLIYGDYMFFPQATTGGQDVIFSYYDKAANTLATGDDMQVYQMWDSYVIFKGTARIYRLLNDDVNRDDYERQAEEILKMAKGMTSAETEEPDLAFYPDF